MLVVFYITKSFKCAGSFLSLTERRRPPVGTLSGFFTSAIVVTSEMVGVLDRSTQATAYWNIQAPFSQE